MVMTVSANYAGGGEFEILEFFFLHMSFCGKKAGKGSFFFASSSGLGFGE